MFCETWLKDDILDSEIQIPDFSLIRFVRKVRAGGGVCVYLRHSVGFDTCLSYSNSMCEVLVLRLHQPSLILVLLYRPPSCSAAPLLSLTNSLLLNQQVDKPTR